MKKNIFVFVFNFYREGFSTLSPVGKKLWIIILIKLFIMFAILKIFFFPDYLKTTFDSDKERSDHVIEQLTNTR